jgi:cytochrome bd-type quinol oxidase subunit 2
MRRMQRSGGVTVIAVFAVLGSLLCLAMGCLMGLTLFFARSQRALDPWTASFARVGTIIAMIFFLVPAI